MDKIKQDQLDQLDTILKQDDENKQTILHLSIANNHLEIIEMLFRDYNSNLKDLREGSNGDLPIHSAARLGSIEILRLLQQYDAVSFKTNNNLENALHLAAFYNRSKFINEFLKFELFLIEQNSKTESTADKFLQCACVCELDLRTYVPCSRIQDSKQNTPLLVALANSHQKCTEELIDNNYIDLNATDQIGNTMYHVCSANDNTESLKYLLDKFNPLNELKIYEIKNNCGDTILHLACRRGSLETTNLIITKISETNSAIDDLLFSKNKDGHNCFHIAAHCGYFNLVEYFLKVG